MMRLMISAFAVVALIVAATTRDTAAFSCDRTLGCDSCHAVVAGTPHNGQRAQTPHPGNRGPIAGLSHDGETLRQRFRIV